MQHKVREVLVIDRVELIERDQVQQMRKFEGGDSLRLQHLAETTNKVLDVRHVCQHVVCGNQICLATSSGNIARSAGGKEQYLGRHTQRFRRGGAVSRWL